MPLTVGGGVRELQDVRDLLNAGADKVSINTAAVQNPDFVRAAAEKFGSQCIVVAIDAKRQRRTTLTTLDERSRAPSQAWEVYIHGGRTPTGLDAVEWAQTHGSVRRRRDPAHQHGPRRHQGRLRHRS